MIVVVQHGTSAASTIRCRRDAADGLAAGDVWTDAEADAILAVISDAVLAGSPLEELQFPVMKQPLPEYSGGAVRCYRLPRAFTGPRHLSPTRYGLAARDYHRWNAIWQRIAPPARR